MLEQWEKVLEDLKGKLNRDTPTKKVFKQRQVNRNPWNIGDVYAYRFHSEESKKMGLYGKYIPIQKVEDVEWYNGWIFSKIQFFDKVFDTVPKIKDIEGIRILPFDTGDRFSDGTPKELTLGVVMNIIMTIHFPKEYKKEYFTFIGNKVNEHSQFCDSVNCIEYNWICLEEILCPAYKYWQDYTVVTEEGKLVPNKLK